MQDTFNLNDIKSISQNGFFDVYFSFLGSNGEVVNSNIETFQVNSNNIELSILSQNISLLRDNISDKYNLP